MTMINRFSLFSLRITSERWNCGGDGFGVSCVFAVCSSVLASIAGLASMFVSLVR